MGNVRFDIDSASYFFLKSNPPVLVVTVPGTAPTPAYRVWLEPDQNPPVQNGALKLRPKSSALQGTFPQIITNVNASFQIVFDPPFDKIILVDDQNEIEISLSNAAVPAAGDSEVRQLAGAVDLPLPLAFPLHPKKLDRIDDIIGMTVRTIRPGASVTFDLNFNRLNLFLNEDGVIMKYSVG
jgi:hypothetical protein